MYFFFSLTERNTDNFFLLETESSALCVYGTKSRVADWGYFIVKIGQVWFGTNFCEELALYGGLCPYHIKGLVIYLYNRATLPSSNAANMFDVAHH